MTIPSEQACALRLRGALITMEIYTDVIDDDTRDALGRPGDLLE